MKKPKQKSAIKIVNSTMLQTKARLRNSFSRNISAALGLMYRVLHGNPEVLTQFEKDKLVEVIASLDSIRQQWNVGWKELRKKFENSICEYCSKPSKTSAFGVQMCADCFAKRDLNEPET